MSFNLIAHSGHSHQKSTPPKDSQQKTQNTQPNPKSDRPEAEIVTPESAPTSKPQILEVPITKSETLTKQEMKISPKSETATLVPGFGESIFVLLIVSPFLLLEVKRRLHK